MGATLKDGKLRDFVEMYEIRWINDEWLVRDYPEPNSGRFRVWFKDARKLSEAEVLAFYLRKRENRPSNNRGDLNEKFRLFLGHDIFKELIKYWWKNEKRLG